MIDIVSLERDMGAVDFRSFTRIAWPHVEPNALREGWHMHAIQDHLTAVSEGQIRNLVICVPPGTSKSLLASTLWGAWDWIRHNTRRWICATYAQDLSDKNARLQRDLISSRWYQERWGSRVKIGKHDVDKVRLFSLESGGWRMSTGVEGVATGWHGDILLGDDLAKAQDASGRAAIDPVAIQKGSDFWFKTLHTRRADAVHTARVLIAQRLHHEDTPGAAIEAGYEALVLPMEYDPKRSCVTVIGFRDPRTTAGDLLCPDRFPREIVEGDRAVMGPLAFEAQMQQDPTPQQGLLFKSAGREDRRYRVLPKGARKIITCDAAFKDTKGSDFVSIQVWAIDAGRFYLCDNDTRRMNFGETCRALLAMRAAHPDAIGCYVEDKANGPAIIETLEGQIPGVVAWNPGAASKISRAESVAPLFDAGSVWLPEDDLAPWLGAYLTELRKFPLTKHDDQVDATTMALLILHQPKYAILADAYAKMAGRTR